MSDPLRRKRAEEELERIKAPVDTALLDDISRGVRQLNARLAAQVPEGIKDEIEVDVSGVNPVPMQPLNSTPPYFKATVFNDGPDPVYVFLNQTKVSALRKAPLNQGDRLDIDTTEAKIQSLFFACPDVNNNASVRIHVLK